MNYMPAFHCPPFPSKYMYYMHYKHLNSLLGAAQKNIMDCSQAAPPLQFRHDKPKGYQVSLQRRGVGDLKHSQEMKLVKRETLLETLFQQALTGCFSMASCLGSLQHPWLAETPNISNASA